MTAVVLVTGALVLGVPGIAVAQDDATSSASVARVGLLAEGIGMREGPSVRVRAVQRVLARRGYDLGPPGVDGRFGPLTAAAVRRYQARNELAVDGVVGPRTRRALARLQERQQRRVEARRDAAPRDATEASGEAQPTQRPEPQPAEKTPPTVAAPADAGGDDSTALLVVLSVIGVALLALAALLGSMLGRRRAGPDVVSIGREVLLEGHSADPRIGAFRGFALASSAPRDGDGGPTRFLIDDSRKPAPIWVSGDDVARSTSDLGAQAPVIGYVTVANGPSDHEQQAYADIEAACAQRGWELVELVRDQEQTRMLERPGLNYALKEIAAGNAHALVVSDLQRLTRSLVDLGALLEWFREAHATLIALDLDLDTTTSHGDHIASTLITLSHWERDRIGSRTRSALARVRAEGQIRGRPAVADHPELLARIAAMRKAGMTLQGISDQLNDENVPTLRGGARWRPSSVQAALGYKRPSARNPKDQLPTIHADAQHG